MDKQKLEAFWHVQAAIASLEPTGDTLSLAYLHQALDVIGDSLGITLEANPSGQGPSLQ